VNIDIEGIKQELAEIRKEAQALKAEVHRLQESLYATRFQIREAFPEAYGFDDY
jgi:cell division protein FtsB